MKWCRGPSNPDAVPGVGELRIEDQLEFARLVSFLPPASFRRCTDLGKSSQGAFPEAAVAEGLFDCVALAGFDETDDLHLRPASRTD
jgi:hypothetical protein